MNLVVFCVLVLIPLVLGPHLQAYTLPEVLWLLVKLSSFICFVFSFTKNLSGSFTGLTYVHFNPIVNQAL
jgi:hypothetical protein